MAALELPPLTTVGVAPAAKPVTVPTAIVAAEPVAPLLTVNVDVVESE